MATDLGGGWTMTEEPAVATGPGAELGGGWTLAEDLGAQAKSAREMDRIAGLHTAPVRQSPFSDLASPADAAPSAPAFFPRTYRAGAEFQEPVKPLLTPEQEAARERVLAQAQRGSDQIEDSENQVSMLGGSGYTNTAPVVKVNPVQAAGAVPGGALLSAPGLGALQAQRGLEQMTRPETKEKLRGAGNVAIGGFQTLSPAMLGLAATDPLMAVGWLGLAKGMTDLSTDIGKRSGMSDEDAQETGDLVGMLPIAYGLGEAGLRGLINEHARLRAEAAQRNKILSNRFERMQNGAQLGLRLLNGEEPQFMVPTSELSEELNPDGTPKVVQGQQKVTLKGGFANTRGEPVFHFFDEQGKSVHSGNASAIRKWVYDNGATPVVPEQPAPEAAPDPVRQARPLAQEYGPGAYPGEAPGQQITLTRDELDVLNRNPDDIADPRQRAQVITRQQAVANKLQLIQNARAADVDPFAGFEEEVAAHPTKGAGVRPDFSSPQGGEPPLAPSAGDLGFNVGSRPPEDLVREPDGSYTVKDRKTGQTLFNGSIQESNAFINQRAVGGAPAPEATTTTPAGSPSELPVEQEEPTKIPPNKTERVSEATPHPPTAAVQTLPETPETIAYQMDQLATGKRRVVMFPKGGPMPTVYPTGTAVTHDPHGNVYVYRNDLTTRSAVRQAAQNNTLHELLGDAQIGLGAPDKSEIKPGEEITVVTRAPDGTEVQSTVTNQEHLPTTLAANESLTPAGGTVNIEQPEQVLADRQGAAPPAPSQTGLDQLGQMGTAITQNMYDMLWPKVEAGDINEAGAPSALLQAAKMVRAGGGLQTREQFQAFAQEYAQIPRGNDFQQAMRDLVARHIPAAPAGDFAAPEEVGGQQTTTPVDTASTQVETRPQWAKDDEESKARAKAREIVIAEDKDDGIAAVIAPIDNGKWFGGLRDTDTDEMVGGQIFKTREKATAYARTLISMKGEPRDFGLEPEAEAAPVAENQDLAEPEAVGDTREAEGPHGTWLLAIPDSGMWTVLAVHPKHQGGTISADDFPLVHRTIKDVLDKRDLGFENVVGYANFTPFEHTDGTYHSTFTEVVPDWRRRGIASALYDFGEKVIGAKITPSKGQTEDGEAFSNSRVGPKEAAPAPVTKQDLAEPEAVEREPAAEKAPEKAEPMPAEVDPIAPPGPRWTGDRGAMPGEPAYELDEDENGEGIAALIELDTPRGSLWEAVLADGTSLGKYSTVTGAAKAAEDHLAKAPTLDLSTPEGIEQTETIEPEEEPGADTGTASAGGSRTEHVRPEGDGALAGEPAQDVRGTGEDGETLPGDLGSGDEHHGTAPGAPVREGQDAVRPGAGDSVPGVVSPAGGARTSDIRPDPTPTNNLAGDFRLTVEEAAAIENSGAKTRARANIEAIRTIKQIIAEGNRPATLEEQQKIAKFVGWGMSEIAQGMFTGYKSEWAGLRANLEDLLTDEERKAAGASTKNAHYTRRDVAAAMWDALKRMGFHAGQSVIEPGMGIGNFFMMMPEDLLSGTTRTGVELDLMTGAMARALFPGSNVLVKGFQHTNLPNDYFDAAIGNVPFAKHAIVDPAYKRQPALTQNVHNYFFAKTMDKLRPGGVMFVITSRHTMDSKNTAFRKWMDERGELLGAIRLPRDTFQENAGTSVTVDIIALRKRLPSEVPLTDNKWLESRDHTMPGGEKVSINEYFHAHPEMMMGEMRPGTQYVRGYPELFGEFSMDKLNELLGKLPANVIADWTAGHTGASDELVENYPDASHIKDHQYGIVKGLVVQREGGVFKPVVKFKGKQLERLRGMIALRGAAREVVRTQRLEMSEEQITKARKDLNKEYADFISEHGPVNLQANAIVFGGDPDWPVVAGLLEDFEKGALKKVPQNVKSKGKWSVSKDGKEVAIALGKERYVIAKTRAVFHGRTIQKPQRIEKVETAAEALAVSLNDLARMDWDRMQELTGLDPDTLRKDLVGKIFRNPTSKKWETVDEYLSGNVRQKLVDAKFIAEEHPEFQANVEALEKVQPNWKPASKIKASLGSTWIPDTDYSQFAAEVLKVENAMGARPQDQAVHYIVQTGSFAVRESPNFFDAGVANTTEYGTAYYDGIQIFEKALNFQTPVARDTEVDMDGNERQVKNPDETIKLVEKQQKLKDAFVDWLWKDAERSERLEKKYNIELNNLRLREYDGSHLTFPGMNKSWLRSNDLDKHQKDAVWRTIQSGNTLYAHVVGAGKTLEMIAAAMELRRLGMRKKPMMVVPNHLVRQWSDDWMRAYPGAQILVPTKKDFQKENRQRLMARIASGNYDGVIVGHKGFEKLGVKTETYKAFMEEQTAEIYEAIAAASAGISDKDAKKNPTIKQLYRRLASLEAKLEKRLKADEKDTGLTFEELGIDQIFVDEADLFKNLGYTTQMDRIAGLPNTDSGRATDMLLKTRFLRTLHGGDKGVVFATGTPVSNSIAEVWTMMRFLMPSYLEREGFDQFDAWAKTFGETRIQMEVAPEGGRFIQRTRFAKFKNAGQMMAMFRLVADIKTASQLSLPTPAVYKGGYVDILAPASEALKEFVTQIGERADAIRSGQVKPEVDNMLLISTQGRKASLDMRLVRPGLPDDPKGKPNLAAAEILKIYKEFETLKGTQLVFLDLGTPKSEKSKKKSVASQGGGGVLGAILNAALKRGGPTEDEDEDDPFAEKKEEDEEEEVETAEEERERSSVYENIKRKLVEGGIPADEIAFAQDAKTDGQKQDQFDRMNSGSLRVLLGSTEKMGAGTNVQRRLVALHHLDAPWRPRDMAQRDGRIVRQGNELYDNGDIKSVRLLRYMTEGSFDAFMWQTLAAKAGPIDQLMEGDPNLDEVEEMSPFQLSAEQAMAISSGNPEIKEKIILDQDIHKLDVLRGAFLSEQNSINQQMATLPSQIKGTKNRIQEYEEDIATRDANPDMVVAGEHFTAGDFRIKGGSALFKLLDSMGPVGKDGKKVDATYRGFELQTVARTFEVEGRTEKGRKARSYVRESTGDRVFKYYELLGNLDVADMKTERFMPEELKLKPLSEKEADEVHAEWNKTKGDVAAEIPWRSTASISIYTTPGIRLNASSATYAVSSQWGSQKSHEAMDRLKSITGDFDGSVSHQRDELRRFTKKHTELESKYGDTFPQEEKLQQMKRRQAELAVKLGETGDDKGALRASEDASTNPSNPLYKFLADPTASIHAKWLPPRKWQGRQLNGSSSVVKGNLVTPELGVSEEKPSHRGASPTWSVHHVPSGILVRRGLRTDWHAVDYARKAAKALDWNWTKMPAEFRPSAFNDDWKPPTETPEQSKVRLNADPDDWYVERGEGEVSLEHGTGPGLVRRSEGERGSIILSPKDLQKLQEFAGDVGELFTEDIAPVFREAAKRLSRSLDDIRRGIAPQTRGEPARKAYGQLREMISEQDQRRDRAYMALKAFRDYFYKSTPKMHGVYGLDIYDAIETGNMKSLSPLERAFAQTARELFDGRHDELETLGVLRAYIDNYLPHEYSNSNEAGAWVQSWMQKRPLAGSEAFRKQRKYPTLKEALEDPDFTLKAKFDNPVDFILSKLAQMDKSITAHMVYDELRSEERIKFVRAGHERKARSQGLAPIDDKIFTVLGPRHGGVKFDIKEPDRSRYPDDEDYENALNAWSERMATIDQVISPENVRVFGRREMGRYWAADPLAQVVNNHLSPGIQLDAFRLWRDVNNTLNMVELTASWFHGMTTALNSTFSDLALAMKQLAAKKPLEAAKSAGRAAVPFASAVNDYLRGTKLQAVWDGTDANPDPLSFAIVEALKKGGGRARQDLYYATNWVAGMKSAWNRQDNIVRRVMGTSARAPFAAIELFMKPIMEYMVPRIKLGAFAKRVVLELESKPDMSLDEARETFGKIWDSMDNRFGQLSQKNLMMNGIARNVMNAVVGRPGWNIGTMREVGGGFYDALKMIGDGARGKPVEFTDRTAYLIALLIGSAIINAVVSWALSGEPPKELMDYVMPRDGGLTEDGKPSRIVLPTYLSKDLYSYMTRPTATLVAKSSPVLSLVGGIMRNRTWRDEKIFGHGAVGPLSYLGSFVTPYAVQGITKNRERGESVGKTLLPLVGIMPAGRQVGLSPAEKLIAEYQQEHGEKLRPAPSEHSRARTQFFLAQKAGDTAKANQIAREAVAKGTLTRQDIRTVSKSARTPSILRGFNSLPVTDDGMYTALKAYERATPEERKQVDRVMVSKLRTAVQKPSIWDDEMRGLAKKLFHVKAPGRGGDFAAPAEVQ